MILIYCTDLKEVFKSFTDIKNDNDKKELHFKVNSSRQLGEECNLSRPIRVKYSICTKLSRDCFVLLYIMLVERYKRCINVSVAPWK